MKSSSSLTQQCKNALHQAADCNCQVEELTSGLKGIFVHITAVRQLARVAELELKASLPLSR